MTWLTDHLPLLSCGLGLLTGLILLVRSLHADEKARRDKFREQAARRHERAMRDRDHHWMRHLR